MSPVYSRNATCCVPPIEHNFQRLLTKSVGKFPRNFFLTLVLIHYFDLLRLFVSSRQMLGLAIPESHIDVSLYSHFPSPLFQLLYIRDTSRTDRSWQYSGGEHRYSPTWPNLGGLWIVPYDQWSYRFSCNGSLCTLPHSLLFAYFSLCQGRVIGWEGERFRINRLRSRDPDRLF